ncbi:hypothetical protein GCM10011613_21080 [Cellvibrio zantedeschiae]|uniref:Type II secretion system protein GspB C-terminal domain-containing protein n=1 Tax=Cellvibrio zantedeschiae TaxID=1237077 RepID=A0ABQ3B6D2_9GAMM|nr:general secretion pathway protein GspB [Cellvibrio zantedeschiae]GGY75354.1 hypothetical protein GCM10011613_21080 [Cellvibrio zantedeschiae]
MSLLLDALNKADQERKRNEATPGISSNHENTFDHGTRNKSIVLVAVIAIGLGLLFATIYWLGQRSATPATTTATTSAAVKSSISSQQQKSLATEQTTTTQIIENNAAENNPGTNVSEENIDTSEENVASLYQQNTAAQSTNTTLTLPTPTANAPADVSGASPTSITQFANLPDLHDLPSQVLEKIPSLNYSEHNYNSNGGSVKINGTIHHANDQLSNGLVIDKILEDGMVLHIENYSFKMRALNSWVNM